MSAAFCSSKTSRGSSFKLKTMKTDGFRWGRAVSGALMAVLCVVNVRAEQAAQTAPAKEIPAPPLPGGGLQRGPIPLAKPEPPGTPAKIVLPQRDIPPQFRPIPQPAGVPQSVPIQNLPPRVMLPEKTLAWDADIKEYIAQPGDTNAPFNFYITNISTAPITIMAVKPSCGCTTPRVPPMPWVLAPNEHGDFGAAMDLRGKSGIVQKAVTVETDKGFKVFMIKVVMPALPAANAMGVMGADRTRNLAIAAADRQAVFRGDCAKCHAEPTVGKLGGSLAQAACGICHEAEHRNQMVPDLKNLPHPTDRAFWVQWAKHGKPGSLMPAFAKSEGGPLSDEQIESLADALMTMYPSRAVVPAAVVKPAAALPPPPAR